jgi:hypothetical protein
VDGRFDAIRHAREEGSGDAANQWPRGLLAGHVFLMRHDEEDAGPSGHLVRGGVHFDVSLRTPLSGAPSTVSNEIFIMHSFIRIELPALEGILCSALAHSVS